MHPDLAEPLRYLLITFVIETNEKSASGMWHGRCSLFCATTIDAEEVLKNAKG
jgi:hypothetical protein